MYEESSNNVSIKGIVVKILLIALVICILIWIFPTKKDLEENLSGISNNNGTNVNIDPLLDKIFTQNIQILQNAGRAYYYSATLPKNIGDITKISYQELLTKKYLIALNDKNGNACSTANSYVQLTKVAENKYEMKTFLQCSNEENYIITNLGCTDLCPNACTNTPVTPKPDEPAGEGTDEKEDTYRYLYSCPDTKTSGWSNWSSWSTNSVSSNANREVEEKEDYTTQTVVVGTRPITTTTYQTVVTGEYDISYETVTYKNQIPTGAKNCDDGVQKYDSSGFYLLFTCKTEIKKPITKQVPVTSTSYENIYGTERVYTTMYRYRTRTTSNNSYNVWDSSEKNTTLLNKGCTVVKSELVTTK